MPFKPGQSGNPAGRPPRNDKISLAIRAAALKLSTITPEENLKLMAHDVLRLVYTDPDAPIEARLQCALAALPFEKPRLSATAILTRNEDTLAVRMQRAERRMRGLDVVEGIIDGELSQDPQETPPERMQPASVFPDALDDSGQVIRLEDLI